MKSTVTMRMNVVLFSLLMVSLILILAGTRARADGPVLEVYKWADPSEIWHKDCEVIPHQTTVTCSLYGGGDCAVVGLPVDVMLVLDRSGSMLGVPLDSAKIGANIFVDLLRAIDNAGLVSFGGSVKLNMDLAKMIPFGKTLLHTAINGLNSGGSTPLGDAIKMANGKLAPASASGGKFEVLLTDGDPLTFSGSTDPIDAANKARDQGIVIFVIGLSVEKPDQKELLKKIANITGGVFYEPEYPSALVSIFEAIAYQIICTVGKDIVVTETVKNYLNVLGACFDYSHFSKPPVSCTILGDGSARMTWEIDRLEVGESWSVSFVVDSDSIGVNLDVDVMASSKVNYVNYLGPAVVQIPQAKITVKSCTPDLEATKNDNLYGEEFVDGNFSPGDTIKYDVVIHNDGYDATEVFYCDTVDVHTTLIADSIKAPGAPASVTVAGDNSSFCVDVGTILEGGTVNISFLVEIEEPFPAGLNQVVNQGFVASKELDDVPTDDPGTTPPPAGQGDDPTITPVVAGAVIQATKTYAVISGGGAAPGTITPGGVIEYTVALQNIGNQGVSGLTYHDNMPTHTKYHGGFQNTCGGTVSEPAMGSTNPLIVTNISLIPNGGCTIIFRVQVDPTLPYGVYEVCNQGIVYLPEGSVFTDDPGEPGLSDPTCTPLETEVLIDATKRDAVIQGGGEAPGSVTPGGVIEYTVTLQNTGNQEVQGLTYYDEIPLHTTYNGGLNNQCGGSIQGPNPIGGTNPIHITGINLAGQGQCTIKYRVLVEDPVPPGLNKISNQGVVQNIPSMPNEPTDDPDTPAVNDSTITPLETEALIEATKRDAVISGSGDIPGTVVPGGVIEYTITLTNTGNQIVDNLTYYDEMPLYTTYNGGLNNQCGGTVLGTNPIGGTNPIHITGIQLAPNGGCTIKYRVKVDDSVPEGVTEISNQGFVQNIPGTPDEPTDDPDTPSMDDPTDTPLRTGIDIWIIKSVSVVGGGQLFPGSQLRYTIRIGNNGPEDATNLTFEDAIPQYTQLSGGITQNCGNLVTSTPTISITNINLGAGNECTIGFTVTLSATVPTDVTEIVNGGEVCQIPGAACETDTVRIRIQRQPEVWDPEVYKVATNLTNPGQPLDPGHVIEYVITIENPMDVDVEDHIFEDPIPEWTHTLILVNPAPGDPRNASTSDVVRITGIDIPSGGTFEIVFRVTLDVDVPDNVTQICNQGRIHDLADENDEPSDDPSTRQINDPTCLDVRHEIEVWDPEIEAFMVALDVDGGALIGGDVVQYSVTMTNLGPYDVFTLNFYCPLPDHTENLAVTGIPFGAVDISLPDMVFITGIPLSVDQTIEIVFTAQVVSFPLEGVAEISCQGWVENIPEMGDEYTDDPATPTEHDPTVLMLNTNEIKCDINDDGEVTITDLFMQLRHITYDVELTGDEFWAADFNGDETINIIDLMSCINVSVGNAPKRGEPGIEISLADDIAVFNTVVSVPCHLRATVPVAGAWFRVDYDPTFLAPGEAQLTGRSSHMALAQRTVGHSLWMLVYSMEGETMQEGDAPIVSIPFKKAQGIDGETEIRIDGAIAFLPLGEAIILESEVRMISLKSTLPEDFALEQNVPNPFNPDTHIRYRLPLDAHVKLEVHNILGQRVRTLVDEEQTAGDRTVTWNGIDHNGIQVPSGVYFYTITMGEFFATKKMVFAK